MPDNIVLRYLGGFRAQDSYATDYLEPGSYLGSMRRQVYIYSHEGYHSIAFVYGDIVRPLAFHILRNIW